MTKDLMSALQRDTLDLVWASKKLGTAMAARIAMIATTISSSMRVNPFLMTNHLLSVFSQGDNFINDLQHKRSFPLFTVSRAFRIVKHASLQQMIIIPIITLICALDEETILPRQRSK